MAFSEYALWKIIYVLTSVLVLSVVTTLQIILKEWLILFSFLNVPSSGSHILVTIKVLVLSPESASDDNVTPYCFNMSLVHHFGSCS